MILKSGAQFKEKTIFWFKNDKTLLDFDPSSKKSKKFALWLIPFVKSMTTSDLKKYRGVKFHDTEESSKISRKLSCGLEN